MEKILNFLADLKQSNNREWFEKNRTRYNAAHDEFNRLVTRLINDIGCFDSEISPLQFHECTFPIYRDIRFSSDKTPYKTHMAAFLCRQGKKSGYAGYYLHLEPHDELNLFSGSLLAAGVYVPTTALLQSIREEIANDPLCFADALRQASGFKLDRSTHLQRPPKGFSEGHPQIDLLKLKRFVLECPIPPDRLIVNDFAGWVTGQFRSVQQFNDTLNRAIRYVYEEEK